MVLTFYKFHRKTPLSEPLSLSLSQKVASWRPATLFKQIFWHRCFSVNFVETYFVEHLRTAASWKRKHHEYNTVRGLSKIWFFLRKEKLVLSQHCFVYSSNISPGRISFQLRSSVFILDFHLFLRLYLIF